MIAELDPATVDQIDRAARRRARKRYTPTPPLTLRQYVERHYRLEGGLPYRLDQVPHMAEIMDAYSDPRVEELVLMKCTQSSATVGLILGGIAFHMDQEPRRMMAVIPSVDEAEKWSKKKLQPMVEANARLHGKLDDRARVSSNTILEKTYPGGSLGIVGSNSGRAFRMITVATVFSDDVDGWDETAGKGDKNEGDQVTLIRRRTDRVADRKLVWVSTPTRKGARIDALFRRMERRGRFHVACPHCGHRQVLRWGGPRKAYGIKWEQEEVAEGYEPSAGEVLRGTTLHRPNTAFYLCEKNGCVIEERHKVRMVREAMQAPGGGYLAADGEPVRSAGARLVGYWFNGLVIIMPGSEWGRLVREFLEIKDDPEALRGWYNTVMAEPYEERTQKVQAKGIEARAQLYVDTHGNRIEVPDGVGLLTAFADVQHDRLELLVRGWGAKEESWMIAHHRIHGDTSGPGPWQQLDVWRTKPYRHSSGALLRIMALGVDSGDGSRLDQVYDYVRPRQVAGVWACKGQSARQRDPVVIRKQEPKKGRPASETPIRLVNIGTHTLKTTLFSRLSSKLNPELPVPFGYMHMRGRDPDWHNGADAEFFAQFGREVPIRKQLPNGRWVTEWRATGPNEAIDLEVGNIAMLHVLSTYRTRLAELADAARAGGRIQPAQRRRRRILSGGIE